MILSPHLQCLLVGWFHRSLLFKSSCGSSLFTFYLSPLTYSLFLTTPIPSHPVSFCERSFTSNLLLLPLDSLSFLSSSLSSLLSSSLVIILLPLPIDIPPIYASHWTTLSVETHSAEANKIFTPRSYLWLLCPFFSIPPSFPSIKRNRHLRQVD